MAISLSREKTGTLRRGVPQGTVWMSYAYGVSMMLQALYFVALARALGPRDFGAFAGALAAVSIVAPFSGLGTGNLLVMRTARNREAYRDAFGEALVIVAVTGGLLAAVMAVSSSYVGGSRIVTVLAPLAVAEVIFGRLSDLASQCFQAVEQLRWTAHVLVLARLLRLGSLAVLLLSTDVTLGVWANGYLAASVASGVLAILIAVKRLGLPRFARPDIRRVLTQGVFFSVGTASKSIYVDIDKFMLARIGSLVSAGVYTAAYRFVAFAFTPVQALVYASNTRFYRDGEKGARHVRDAAYSRVPAAVGYGVAAGVVLWFAAPLVPVILGHSYADAAAALKWLAVMPVIQGIHYLFGDGLMGLGRQGVRSALQLCVAGLNVGLNLWLIPRYSWRGAAAATIASESLLALLMVQMLSRSARRERET